MSAWVPRALLLFLVLLANLTAPSFALARGPFNAVAGNDLQPTLLQPPVQNLRASNAVKKNADQSNEQNHIDSNGFITLSLKTNAACLDGSPYVFTISRRPQDDPKVWTIWTEGGGQCWNETTCEERANSWQGSSKLLKSSGMMKDPDDCGCLNFNMWGTTLNCTCVRLPYCDGGFFAGHHDDPVNTSNGTSLMIRGRANIEASIRKLLKEYGLADANELAISGTSAGAVSSVLYLDFAKSLVPKHVKVHGVPQGGFTVDHSNNHGTQYFAETLKWTYHFHGARSTLSSECQEAYHHKPWMCLVIAHASTFVKTPLFFLQSKYDSWQLGNILGLDWGDIHRKHEGTGKLLSNVTEYGDDFMDSFADFGELIKHRESQHAAFLTSCICHTDDCNFLYDSLGNMTVPMLIGRWYNDGNGYEPGCYIDDKDPNYDCCMLAQEDNPDEFGCMSLTETAGHPDYFWVKDVV